MARVLFINAGSEGHINPTLQVVDELISRGEEVVYFSIEAFRERIEKTGYIQLRSSSLLVIRLMKHINL
ncbi:glycosyltransferase%2C MGT family [Streptococcus pneumoniae]|nr:glycosyltransferase%2C MGT family [Streptococcus pneumoniae]